MVRVTQNRCNAWTYRSTTIDLDRKIDYLAHACYLCRLYRSCFEHPEHSRVNDDGPGGETVGVKMQSPIEVRNWMEALDLKRCPCIPAGSHGRVAYIVDKGNKPADVHPDKP